MQYRYSTDPNNRLLIKNPKKKIILKPKGSFEISKFNQLIYWFDEPSSWRRTHNLSNKLAFEGNWHLTPNHDLVLKLNKTKNQFDSDRLVLRGKIISVDANSLAFEITSASEDDLEMRQLVGETLRSRVPPTYRQGLPSKGTGPRVFYSFRILKLSGTWQADELNRLIFLVEKKASPDMLIFKAGWSLNKNQGIEYSYERSVLVTKLKSIQLLTFKGFWKITSLNRLIYSLEGSSDSRFEFRAHLENPNIYSQRGAIKYRLGVGLRRGRSIQNALILYGEWKFSRNLGIIFEMNYGSGKIFRIEFGAEVSFSKNKLVFNLLSELGEPLGITLAFNHKIIEHIDAQAFIRLKAKQKQIGFEAGFTLPF